MQVAVVPVQERTAEPLLQMACKQETAAPARAMT
jgi:hypothetical protein